METIERIEMSHEYGEPHDTSFIPRMECIPRLNGTAGNAHSAPTLEPLPPTPLANPASKGGLFRRGTTNDQLQSDTNAPNNTEASGSDGEDKGYLPCHYSDYISGTSTGG
jgi:hypothetical protein